MVPGAGGLRAALKAKDAELYEKLAWVKLTEFWKEWKKVYPEDFPEGGNSPIDASCVVPRHD